MSITFQQFINLLEGKKKRQNALVQAYLDGAQQAAPKVVDYGSSEPNSPERAAQVAAILRDSGGGAIRRAQKEKLKSATRSAKSILKNGENS